MIAGHPRCCAVRCRAYTLLELMIVLSVFGLLAGLSWPMLMRPWSKSRVQQAAQDLSRELLRTRLSAIEQGQVFRFRWRPGTAEYEIRSWNAAAEPIELLSTEAGSDQSPLPIPPTAQQDPTPAGALASNNDAVASSDDATKMSSDQRATTLPAGISFLDPDRPLDPAADVFREIEASSSDRDEGAPRAAPRTSDDEPSAPTDSTAASTNVPWAAPVWFYPDGRTTNARWTLVADDGYQIDVRLRGWVGTVRVGPVMRRDDEDLDDLQEAGTPDDLRPERREPTLP